jgi:hypothetical protein
MIQMVQIIVPFDVDIDAFHNASISIVNMDSDK